MVRVHASVGQYEDVDAVTAGRVAGCEEGLHGLAQAGPDGVEQGDLPDLEGGMVDLPDAPQFLPGQHRRGQLQHGAVLRVVGQKVAVVADVDGAVGLADLPQGVDRRVGDLGEALLEVVEQRRVRLGQRRQRLVRTHGHDGLAARRGHGEDDVVDVLEGVAEGLAEGFDSPRPTATPLGEGGYLASLFEGGVAGRRRRE